MTISKHILVVDDDRNNLALIVRALKQQRSPVVAETACGGREALDYLFCQGNFQARRLGNPDLIMLDLKMPEIDGLEVLRQVKGDPKLKLIPVVMFSSSKDERDRLRSYELGANGYVVKPVDFEEFQEMIRLIATFWTLVNEPPPGSHLERPVLTPYQTTAD